MGEGTRRTAVRGETSHPILTSRSPALSLQLCVHTELLIRLTRCKSVDRFLKKFILLFEMLFLIKAFLTRLFLEERENYASNCLRGPQKIHRDLLWITEGYSLLITTV